MTTVPITITLNLPLSTVENFLPHLVNSEITVNKIEKEVKEVKDEETDSIIKSYQVEKLEKMLNDLNLPEDAKTRIKKLKNDHTNGKQIDMNEVFSLINQYKPYLANVDMNQFMQLFIPTDNNKSGFDFSQLLSTMGPMLNQIGNSQRGRGKRRH